MLRRRGGERVREGGVGLQVDEDGSGAARDERAQDLKQRRRLSAPGGADDQGVLRQL